MDHEVTRLREIMAFWIASGEIDMSPTGRRPLWDAQRLLREAQQEGICSGFRAAICTQAIHERGVRTAKNDCVLVDETLDADHVACYAFARNLPYMGVFHVLDERLLHPQMPEATEKETRQQD